MTKPKSRNVRTKFDKYMKQASVLEVKRDLLRMNSDSQKIQAPRRQKRAERKKIASSQARQSEENSAIEALTQLIDLKNAQSNTSVRFSPLPRPEDTQWSPPVFVGRSSIPTRVCYHILKTTMFSAY